MHKVSLDIQGINRPLTPLPDVGGCADNAPFAMAFSNHATTCVLVAEKDTASVDSQDAVEIIQVFCVYVSL